MANVEPRMARQRLARFADSSVRSSLLSVPAAVGLDAVGLSTVGEVMGASVRQMSRIAVAPNSARGYGASARNPTVRLSSHTWSPFRTIVQTTKHGYASVLARMLDEARAMGADGIVDIRLERSLLDDTLHEFTATGTPPPWMPRASSACSCWRCRTSGAGTRPSSSRSAPRSGRSATTTTSRPRR